MLIDTLKPRSSKIKLMEITPELLLELLKIYPGANSNLEFVSDPIPWTAKALRCGVSEFGNIMILVEDESFLEVYEGQKIPRLDPQYRIECPDVDNF